MQTLFYNVRLVDAFCDTDGAVLVENGFISDIFWGHIKPASIFSSKEGEQMLCIDGKGLALMPAFVDMHAHFRYPGLPQKEELDTALRAAAAGGFGTLLLMPNTKPVVSSPEQAKKVQLDAQKHNLADVIQSLSITGDFGGEDTSHLDNLDCTQFPVVSEDGFDVEAASVMFEAMKKCAKNNIIVSCHCEDVSLAKAAKVPRKAAIEIKQSDAPDQVEIKKNMAEAERLLALAEDLATTRNLALAEAADCNIHITHCSTTNSLAAVAAAKTKRNSKVSCDVTPHHIYLSDKVKEFVNPPIRSEADRLALIAGIKNGTVDMIGTDHAPHTLQDKADGACGFTGLETAFAVCYQALVLSGAISLSELSALMSANPAKRLGVNCGILRPGRQANFVLIDLQEKWTVDSTKFFSKGKYSPYNGETFQGKIMQTYRRGKLIYNAE